MSDEKKITLELSEHDASRLLLLIKKEIDQSDQIWWSYWERLARNVEQSIIRESFRLWRSTHFNDLAGH